MYSKCQPPDSTYFLSSRTAGLGMGRNHPSNTVTACSAARKGCIGAFPAGIVPLFFAGLASGLIRATAGAGMTLGVCTEHTACDSDQFCLATICESDSLEMPCTRCADCKYCNRSASIDGICPAKCPNEFDLQNLQVMDLYLFPQH